MVHQHFGEQVAELGNASAQRAHEVIRKGKGRKEQESFAMRMNLLRQYVTNGILKLSEERSAASCAVSISSV